jgi:hypothetical protein
VALHPLLGVGGTGVEPPAPETSPPAPGGVPPAPTEAPPDPLGIPATPIGIPPAPRGTLPAPTVSPPVPDGDAPDPKAPPFSESITVSLDCAMTLRHSLCLTAVLVVPNLTGCTRAFTRQALDDHPGRDTAFAQRQPSEHSDTSSITPAPDPSVSPPTLFDDARWTNDAKQPRALPGADPTAPKERRRWPPGSR